MNQNKAASRWERLIRQECAVLREEGRAWVDKNWEAPPVPGTHIPREKSKPDFSGFLAGGRHVVFEAKATESETSFDFNKVLEHQYDHLQAADDAGAASFLYVLDGVGGRWLIPWFNVVCCEKAGRSSFAFNEGSSLQQQGEWRRRGAAFVWHGENWLETLQRMGGA